MPATEDPPLVSLKVTNPVTYIKSWWKKVIGNEGVNFSFRIRPLTAIAIAMGVTLVLTGAGFGLGRISVPWPSTVVRYVPSLAATPTPAPWRETAFSGNLKYSDTTQKYFLVTTSAEAITLDVPPSINLEMFVGKRILASGDYNKTLRTLVVKDALSMEVLPTKAVTIPTIPQVTQVPRPTEVPMPDNGINPPL